MSAPIHIDDALASPHHWMEDWGEEEMATKDVVNLDALLPRENLTAPADSASDLVSISLSDLKSGLIYSMLRKPDFQRETANWSPAQVADLIVTYATGNLIPAIILWKSGSRVFVIDGAHRLSALIAWVRDDYGAGSLSIQHYGNAISEYQRAMHDMTRKIVEEKIGTYAEHMNAIEYPGTAREGVAARATSFVLKRIDAQWISGATPEQAGQSFFRINQGGLRLIQ